MSSASGLDQHWLSANPRELTAFGLVKRREAAERIGLRMSPRGTLIRYMKDVL